jgi:hypothetical protein
MSNKCFLFVTLLVLAVLVIFCYVHYLKSTKNSSEADEQHPLTDMPIEELMELPSTPPISILLIKKGLPYMKALG